MKGLRKRILALTMAISMLTPSLAGASNFNGFLQVTEPDNPLPRQEETQDEDKKEDLEETVEEKNEVKTEETGETAEEKEETKKDEKKEEIEENQADETLKTIFSDFDLAMDDRVQIIEGQGVYDTPVRISRTLLEKQKRVILASGESYPDALTATSLVEGQYPVFFVKENSLPTMVGNEILRLEAEEVYILGGPDTISSRVEEELKALKPSLSIKRLAGPTRYETAVEVVKERPKDKAILVDGLNFPDALTAQGLAYIKDQAPGINRAKGAATSY